ncbi:iron(III) transport system substrate-binding protein [Loktanella fryxellensis]|uniref:Iron(III) transport system substrate-binding protein n=1 Tax=Loktanella fryxellensis TaxID=245187 RepID=A0A1H8B3D0_9RHOB|nr:hypothetical protein [Loktanella fryxellensis]SEM77236.1 iron(III) transport system substrate-binding protein [Loktanella fryxellensis]
MATTTIAQDLDTLSAADLLPLSQADGSLTVHAFTSRIGRVEEAFEAAYPGVDMIGFDMTSTEMIARLQNEAAAQIGNADVIYVCNAPVVLTDLPATDLIAPYVPPRVADALPDTAQPRLLQQRVSTKVLM